MYTKYINDATSTVVLVPEFESRRGEIGVYILEEKKKGINYYFAECAYVAWVST